MEPSPLSPPHRRHHSEIDMNSLRRISEALLLAQNRARLATERANRCERVLRMVLAHVNPQQLTHAMRNELGNSSSDSSILLGISLSSFPHSIGISFLYSLVCDSLLDSMADWTIVPSMAPPPLPNPQPTDAFSISTTRAPLALPRPVSPHFVFPSQPIETSTNLQSHAHRRHSFDVRETTLYEDVAVGPSLWTNWPVFRPHQPTESHTEDIATLAAQIIANLERRAQQSDARIAKLCGAQPNWLSVWTNRLLRVDWLTPMQFVAGLVVGVALGVRITRQQHAHWRHLLASDSRSSSCSNGYATPLVKRLAAACWRTGINISSRNSNSNAHQHFPLPIDDVLSMSYFVHPAAVEVA